MIDDAGRETNYQQALRRFHANLRYFIAAPIASPWRSGTEEVAALIPGDLAVNTARVREAVAIAHDHTGIKEETIERALFQHLSMGNLFEAWLHD